jgi:putative molybdopterin biosynthesis protein
MVREQDQFLEILDRDTAERLWWDVIRPEDLEAERVPLEEALGRILAGDVDAEIDVPGFDRSNVDGFAIRAEEIFGAAEESPRGLLLNPEEIATGVVPWSMVATGTATAIATGGMVPRGADAVEMVEHTSVEGDRVRVVRPVAPGSGISFAGTDMARGELLLRRGTRLTSRETGVLVAFGSGEVEVVHRHQVAISSTGDELVAPGETIRPEGVFDANATMLANAVREFGGKPWKRGIVSDDEPTLAEALARC